MVRNVLVYPFSRDFSKMLPYEGLLFREARFHSLISPNGWGIVGQDAGEISLGEKIGLTVGNNFDEALRDNDVLLIANGEWPQDVRRKALDGVALAARLGKDIWCALCLTDEELADISAVCREAKTEFTYLHHSMKDAISEPQNEYVIEDIDSAVIFVGEVMPNIDAYEILLSLGQSFKNAGYRVSAVGNRLDGALFGVHVMPDFLRANMNADQMIYAFNQYIRELEKKEAPNLIIVQLPDCLVKYNNSFLNGGGVLPYIVSQALQPDYTVVCVPLDAYEENTMQLLSETFHYRFGYGADFFHMSNIHLDVIAIVNTGILNYNYPDVKSATAMLSGAASKAAIPVANVIDGNHGKLFKHALDKLSGFTPAVNWQKIERVNIGV